MRVVIDTNSLIVSIGRKSEFRPIFDALLEGKIKLLISNDIVGEYLEILTERTTAIVANNVVELLLKSRHVERIEIYFKWELIDKDGDDNKFVDCALNGRASFLVTDDRHYRHLKNIPFPRVEVLRTEEFVKMLETL
jgi:putative PIN family toxin of toxin-antitoxin system